MKPFHKKSVASLCLQWVLTHCRGIMVCCSCPGLMAWLPSTLRSHAYCKLRVMLTDLAFAPLFAILAISSGNLAYHKLLVSMEAASRVRTQLTNECCAGRPGQRKDLPGCKFPDSMPRRWNYGLDLMTRKPCSVSYAEDARGFTFRGPLLC